MAVTKAIRLTSTNLDTFGQWRDMLFMKVIRRERFVDMS